MEISRHTPINDLPEFLTVPEVAQYLGVAETTVYLAIQAGRLHAVSFGALSAQYPRSKVIRIPRATLAAFAKVELETAGAR